MKQLVKAYDIEQEDAKKKWKEYCEYLRSKKGKNADETITQLKDTYYHLSQGRQVIDIYESMKIAGKNEFDQPKLAIIRADQKEVVFQKRDDGAGAFWAPDVWRYNYSNYPQVAIPKGYFSDWRVDMEEGKRFNGEPYIIKKIKEKSLKCPVPIIPAEYLPDGQLHRYFILWEVEKWEKEPPKDPFLLKRITSNLFVVLAVWDLTELERAVMRGAIL